jgi:NDP-sugar pyrophosphorylase family protein
MKKPRIEGAVDRSATIREPVIIEKGAVVGKNAVVGPYVHLMGGAEVGEGATVEGSIVFDGAKICANAVVKDSLVDGNAVVGEGTHVDSYCMLGYGSKLGKNARMLGGSAVWPFVEAGDDAVVEGKIDIPEEIFRDRLAKSGFWAKRARAKH